MDGNDWFTAEQRLLTLLRDRKALRSDLIRAEEEPVLTFLSFSPLSGATEQRADEVRELLDRVWRQFDAYDEAVQEIADMRNNRDRLPRRAVPEVLRRLEDKVVVNRVADPVDEDDLRLTLTEAADLVRAKRNEAREALRTIDGHRTEANELSQKADRLMREATQLETRLLNRSSHYLEQLWVDVARLTLPITTDPLAWRDSAPEMEDVCRRLAERCEGLRKAVLLVSESDGEEVPPDTIRQQLAMLGLLESDLGERHAHARARVGNPCPPEPVTYCAELEDERAQIALNEGDWVDNLDDWLSLRQAVSEAVEDVRFQIASRSGLLDWRERLRADATAYWARAERLGLDRDPHLARRWDELNTQLYSAPLDLEDAEEKVSEFIRRIRGE
ncbi:hypothetical protein [Salininema proteolyticum]|uniref:Uncharacterized protein n=1 Tax=Salininema proteolyticum TaxID=1607685 RepID=A0ABV8TZ41_9ACTN